MGEMFFIPIFILSIFLAYLIGSLPFSFLVPKIFKGIDIRTVGSKNVGATNVFRNCGKGLGFLAFILDFSKGGLVFRFAIIYFKLEYALILGFICVLGHSYSVFLKFKGGKGVASSAGLVLFLNPKLFLILAIVFIAVVFLTRYVSLASIILGILISPIYYILTKNLNNSLILLALGLFVIYRHSSNISRLINGTENKIKVKK